MNKRLQFFETEPIIAAVKTEEQLERALTSGSNIIFFLFGNICNIPKLVESVKERGKYAFVHLDLINGLAAKEIAADYIRSFTRADGVLSTKPPILRHAKEIGLITVLRVFVLDSLALDNIAPSVIQKIMRHSKFTTTQGYILSLIHISEPTRH